MMQQEMQTVQQALCLSGAELGRVLQRCPRLLRGQWRRTGEPVAAWLEALGLTLEEVRAHGARTHARTRMHAPPLIPPPPTRTHTHTRTPRDTPPQRRAVVLKWPQLLAYRAERLEVSAEAIRALGGTARDVATILMRQPSFGACVAGCQGQRGVLHARREGGWGCRARACARSPPQLAPTTRPTPRW